MAKSKKKAPTTPAPDEEVPFSHPLVCSNDTCPNVLTFNPLKLRACSRCHSVQYCCTACQTNDWKVRHKGECARQAALHQEYLKSTEGKKPNVADGPQPGDIIIPIDTSQLDDIIDDFNALPRPYKSPHGMFDNHWSFDLRHVSLHPATDVVLLYHPASGFVHVEPLPSQIDSLNPVVVAVALLKCFNDGLQGCKPFAPWTLSAPQKDAALAKEVAGSLQFLGVREELCKVGVARAKDVAKADEKWKEIVGGLKDHSRPDRPTAPPKKPAANAGAG